MNWELLFRNGTVSHHSDEFYHRYRGTEYLVEVKKLGTCPWIFAHIWSYPNTEEWIEGMRHYYRAADLNEIKAALKSNPELSLMEISPGISREKYEDMKNQATSIPVCPHCKRVWD